MSRVWLGGLCLAGLVSMATASSPSREAFDPDKSSARFEVHLRMSGDVPGSFRAIEGELAPAGDGQWRVQVRVDARDLELDGPGWMLRSTRSRSFLDVERHPEITFTSEPFDRGLLKEGGPLGGELQLRGRTGAVAFTLVPSTCRRPGHGCDIRVLGEISRRAFGMNSQRMWVRDEVGFDFRVRLRHAASP
jgi:polyisoprenoid-binding protein YceI